MSRRHFAIFVVVALGVAVFAVSLNRSDLHRDSANAPPSGTTRAARNPAHRSTGSAEPRWRPAVRLAAAETIDKHRAQKTNAMGTEAYERIEAQRMQRDRERYQKLKNLPRRTPMQTSIMRAIEKASRYPRSNHRFSTPDLDPVAREANPERRESLSEDGARLLTIWASANQVDAGTPIVVRATLARIDVAANTVARPLAGELSASIAKEGGPAGPRVSMTPVSSGQYVASFDTSPPTGADLPPGLYKVRVEAGDALSDSVAVLVRPSYGRLTGRYRDRVEAGDLVVEAELNAYETGDYQLFASLYTADDMPVGTAEANAPLGAGLHWLALRFHGRLMHDSGADGPYRLGHLSVKQRAFPPLEGVRTSPDHWTEAYPLSAFDQTPYNDLPAGPSD